MDKDKRIKELEDELKAMYGAAKVYYTNLLGGETYIKDDDLPGVFQSCRRVMNPPKESPNV